MTPQQILRLCLACSGLGAQLIKLSGTLSQNGHCQRRRALLCLHRRDHTSRSQRNRRAAPKGQGQPKPQLLREAVARPQGPADPDHSVPPGLAVAKNCRASAWASATCSGVIRSATTARISKAAELPLAAATLSHLCACT